MQQRIFTDYSNQLHQLLVSVSRHLYVTKNGIIKYQEKPADVNIKNCCKPGKERLVYYIIRDHFSGSFVFQVASTKSLVPLAEFLYWAWNQDDSGEKFLWGKPDALFIPKNISSPGLFRGLERLGIKPLNPPSGFASGVRIIRDIEENLYYLMDRTVNHTVEGINSVRSEIYRLIINPAYADSKYDRWKENLPSGHPRKVPHVKEFMQIFVESSPEHNGLPLVNLQRDEPVESTGRKKPNKAKRSEIGQQPYSEEKLYQAQELIYEAWEMTDRQRRLDMARMALSISPYCADAYVLLAIESDFPQESLELYKKGVQAGRLVLGDKQFKEYAGHFWGFIETRPYMRAMFGLAQCLWKTGKRADAIGYYKEMLRLNPNDNQGVRYILVNSLLAEGLDGEAGQLLSENADDDGCLMAYSRIGMIAACRNSGGPGM